MGFAALFAVAIGVIVAQSTPGSLLQATGRAGRAWVIANAAPTPRQRRTNAAPAPALQRPIVTALAAVLGRVALVGAVWVKVVMQRSLFGATGELPR